MIPLYYNNISTIICNKMVPRNALIVLLGLFGSAASMIHAFQASNFVATQTTTRKDRRLAASAQGKEYFQVELNEFFKKPVPAPIKNAFAIYREQDEGDKLDVGDAVTLLTAAPGSPGVPRPLWLVMLGSIPSGLLWYGYYKFAVEEELLQMELETGKQPQGFGGYGTLGPFTYGMLLGPIAAILHIPGGINWSAFGVIFIYYTQFLLYDRVNTLIEEEGVMEKPLQVWWCLPIFFPFNLIVGLRQVHFLAQYLYRQRGINPPPNDIVADFFPFIKEPSFTWQQFLLTPSLWCSLLSDVETIDAKSLPEPVQELMKK